MVRERVSWIDVAKGFGILFVLYGHALNADSIRYILYSFHMPLFFLLSGIVFRHLDHETFSSFIKKDFRKILIPYYIFAFAGLFLWIILMDPQDRSIEGFVKQVYGIFFGNGATNGYLGYNVALWFLPALFITKVGFWLVTAVFKKKQTIIAALFAFSITGYLGSVYFQDVKLPFGIESALSAIVFFGAGYLFHTLPDAVSGLIKKHFAVITVLALAVTIVIATISFWTFGTQVDLRLNRLHDYGFFYGAAFAGILATLALSRGINANRVLEYLGKGSMILFVWHQIVYIYLSKFLVGVAGEPFINMYRNTLLAPVYTLVAIVVIFSVAWVFRYFHSNFLSKSYSELN